MKYFFSLFVLIFSLSAHSRSMQCHSFFRIEPSAQEITQSFIEKAANQNIRNAQPPAKPDPNAGLERLNFLIEQLQANLTHQADSSSFFALSVFLKEMSSPHVLAAMDNHVTMKSVKLLLADLYKVNMASTLKRLNEELFESQKQQLMDLMLSLPTQVSLSARKEGVLDNLWRLIWMTRLSFTPEQALKEMIITTAVSGPRMESMDSRMAEATIVGLFRHDSDIVEVFSNIPQPIFEKYRRIFFETFYLKQKYSSGLKIWQKFNQQDLSQLVKDIESQSTHGKVDVDTLSSLINSYWTKIEGVPVEVGNIHNRGLYGFATVASWARAIQRTLRSPLSLLRPNSIYAFGSFPNGMARFFQGDKQWHMRSDIDITFERPFGFFNQKIRGADWARFGNTKSRAYRLMERLEERSRLALGNPETGPGQILSPLTHYPGRLFVDPFEVMGEQPMLHLANPFILQVAPRKIILHIHYQPGQARDSQVASFEIDFSSY